ncbi:DUF6339 family protein [Rhodococcus ruber]
MMELRQADAAVHRRITPAFREGVEAIDLLPYESELATGRTVEISTMIELLDATMARFPPNQLARSDSWLGPRLHAALRLTRAEAANPGVWTWLGLGHAAKYIRWRWAPQRDPSRFAGPYYLHGLGRLWWMAELFRNGADYTPAQAALCNGDIAQNFLRMDIAHHRPTCQAFMRVPSRRHPDKPLSGREANALAKAANCAATTLVYEAIGPDLPLDPEARREWIRMEVDVGDLLDGLPAGPDDPEVPEEAIGAITALLTDVFAEAPIRDARDDGHDDRTTGGAEVGPADAAQL